jgi:hypothetical protein
LSTTVDDQVRSKADFQPHVLPDDRDWLFFDNVGTPLPKFVHRHFSIHRFERPGLEPTANIYGRVDGGWRDLGCVAFLPILRALRASALLTSNIVQLFTRSSDQRERVFRNGAVAPIAWRPCRLGVRSSLQAMNG